ncbi:MAG: response regulator, partial [Magnetococcales bacterium]|nr:response regulator [Magnetococcales bacterium]
QYDAVLMDIQMHKMDGLQTTRLIRRNPQHKELPIIAITAHALIDDRIKCLNAGMDDHIGKPIEKQVLYAALLKAIKPREGLGMSDLPDKGHKQQSFIPETIPGIEVDEVLNRLNGNQRLFWSVLTDFSREHSQAARNIRLLLSKNRPDDITEARRVNHAVSGMAGNISAKRLFNASLALGRKLTQDYHGNLNIELDEFEQALTQIAVSIGTIENMQKPSAKNISDNTTDQNTKLDINSITPIIKALYGQVSKKAFDSLSIFDELKPLLSGSDAETNKLADQLEQQVYNLSFASAKQTLKKIGEKLEIAL